MISLKISKYTCEVEDNAKNIMADPELLRRIVSNLITNAVQAMPNGGKLAIHAYTDKKTMTCDNCKGHRRWHT